MPNKTRDIKKDSPLHQKLSARLSSRIKMAEKQHTRMHDKWRRAEEALLAYLPETDEDSIRSTVRDDGKPQYTTIVIPYTYGMLMTAHTYMTSVFLGRSPVHQYQGRHGESEQQIQALEALIGYQTQVGGLAPAYFIWLYDQLKYGVGIVGEWWQDETVQYGRVEEIIDPLTGQPRKVQTTREVPGYRGNKATNISPFDWMHDPRVSVGNFQKGEFVIVKKIIMWNELVRRARQGYYTEAIKDIKTSGRFSPYDHESSGSALERPQEHTLELEDTNELGEKFSHPAFIRAYEVYVDLMPSEWGLGASDYPQKWVFTITADRQTILGAQPLGALHGDFPFLVGEMEVEAYGEYNRGLPEILEGLQQTMDWLINTHFWNVRQTMNNQFIIDPSRITMKDVQKGGPGFVWRMRPEAFGQNPKDSVFQIPVNDVTRAHITDVQSIFSVGERTIGINEQMMGAPPPGGRVTATATRTSAGFGTNRLKTITEWLSASAFAPHSSRLVQNTQQYYSGEEKFRIVGDLMQDAGQAFAQVTPEMIAGAFDFVPVDGTLPVDRFAQATLWKDMFSQIGRIPQIAEQYDLGRIFAWVAQLSGLKNIHRFKVQLGDPAQLAEQAQAGNIIPLRGQPGQSSTMAGQGTALPTPGSPQDVSTPYG